MTKKLPAGVVDIHGREYTTVASRLASFRADFPATEGWGIYTHIEEYVENQDPDILNGPPARVRVRCEIWHGVQLIACARAEEYYGATNNNMKHSITEVAETSAMGRALAQMGYLGTEVATADDILRAKDYSGNTQGGKPLTLEVRECGDALHQALENEDAAGFKQVWDEMSQEEQLLLGWHVEAWSGVGNKTKYKQAWRDILKQAQELEQAGE